MVDRKKAKKILEWRISSWKYYTQLNVYETKQ